MQTNKAPSFEDQDPDVMDWEDVAHAAMQPMPSEADFVGAAGDPVL